MEQTAFLELHYNSFFHDRNSAFPIVINLEIHIGGGCHMGPNVSKFEAIHFLEDLISMKENETRGFQWGANVTAEIERNEDFYLLNVGSLGFSRVEWLELKFAQFAEEVEKLKTDPTVYWEDKS